MRKLLCFALVGLSTLAGSPRMLHAQTPRACYHCDYDDQGNAFCHPITLSGGSRSCNPNNPTEVLPGFCELSGGGCSSALRVTPDGRALASTVTTNGRKAGTTDRRPCDGAILERRYSRALAGAMRARARTLRV
jgi:hypothetical protein